MGGISDHDTGMTTFDDDTGAAALVVLLLYQDTLFFSSHITTTTALAALASSPGVAQSTSSLVSFKSLNLSLHLLTIPFQIFDQVVASCLLQLVNACVKEQVAYKCSKPPTGFEMKISGTSARRAPCWLFCYWIE